MPDVVTNFFAPVSDDHHLVLLLSVCQWLVQSLILQIRHGGIKLRGMHDRWCNARSDTMHQAHRAYVPPSPSACMQHRPMNDAALQSRCGAAPTLAAMAMHAGCSHGGCMCSALAAICHHKKLDLRMQ